MEELARAIIKIVIAQISQHHDFTSVQSSAFSIFVSVVERYLLEIGKRIHSYTELANRCESNWLDVKAAFLSLHPHDDILRELRKFKENTPHLNFPVELPSQFPVPVEKEKKEEAIKLPGDTPTIPFIPSFLPSFPSSHTYAKSEIYVSATGDSEAAREMKMKEAKLVEKALNAWFQKFDYAGLVNYDSVNDDADKKWKDIMNDRQSNNTMDVEEDRVMTPLPKTSEFVKGTYIALKKSSRRPEKNHRYVPDKAEEEERRKRIDKILTFKHENNVVVDMEKPKNPPPSRIPNATSTAPSPILQNLVTSNTTSNIAPRPDLTRLSATGYNNSPTGFPPQNYAPAASNMTGVRSNTPTSTYHLNSAPHTPSTMSNVGVNGSNVPHANTTTSATSGRPNHSNYMDLT